MTTIHAVRGRAGRPLDAALALAEPWLSRAFDRIVDEAQTLSTSDGLRIEASAVADAAAQVLADATTELLGRVGIVELHEARDRGELRGATPDLRFQDFFDRLARPGERGALLARYPGLDALLAHTVESRADALLELLVRLHHDWPELLAAFAAARLAGPLVTVEAHHGDPHRGGRSVAVLGFASGWRLVYKPRSVGPEAHWQDLLRWADDHGARPGFRRLRVVERPGYGYMEHVAPAACTSRAATQRFYRRLGGQLALLHVIAATDIHHENVIAHGEHPMVIDLEAAFHPRLADATRQTADPLESSVLRVGLLPTGAVARSPSASWKVSSDGLGLTSSPDDP